MYVYFFLWTKLDIPYPIPTVAVSRHSGPHFVNHLIGVTLRAPFPTLHNREVNKWLHAPVLLDLLHMLEGEVLSWQALSVGQFGESAGEENHVNVEEAATTEPTPE